MKIILLITLLTVGQILEQRHEEQFYIRKSELAWYMRVFITENKPAIFKQLNPYFNQIDSTMKEIDEFRQRYFCTDVEDAKKIAKWIFSQTKKRIRVMVN